MGYEPVTACKKCGDRFDVYHAAEERICDSCKELSAVNPYEECAKIAEAEIITDDLTAEDAHWNMACERIAAKLRALNV